MSETRGTAAARLINLVIPGGGLILIGSEVVGTLIALLFAVVANFAVAAGLLFPDDLSATARNLGIGVALGTYLGAQIRYAQTVRYRREVGQERQRRAALHAARAALERGRADEAWQALEPIADRAEDDLLVAYRVAQVLTARGAGRDAATAWQRVQRLDRHRIYRREVIASARRLSEPDSARPGS